MALPNKATMTFRKLRKRTSNKQARICILIILLSSIIWTFVIHQQFDDTSESASSPEALLHVEKTIEQLSLPSEWMFTKTLKHCLPKENKKCKTYVPENSGQRIALLAPPGELTRLFSSLVEQILKSAKYQTRDGIGIEWIQTSHMAPYGYGKTHGLTKIIRIVPEPLLLGASDTLLNQSFGSSSSHGDIEASLRQQIRYHCRLNHIAAHTALWTLRWKELSNMPIETLVLQIQEFLDIQTQSQQLPSDEKTSLVVNQKKAISKVTNEGLKFLKDVEGSGSDYIGIFDSILFDEMRMSGNLTAWPCQSFWTVGKPPENLQLSPSTSRIAKAMSPDCTSTMNTCFVKRDKCEANGDGKCE
eukprot:scaffold2299_cov131-Cylindrotheca_fusiformis.AAC.36